MVRRQAQTLPAKGVTDPVLAQAIVENALSYAIFTLDFDGTILSWSPGAQQVVGYTAEEAIGVSFSTIFAPSDQVAGADRLELQTAIADGRAEDTRWHIRKNGERFWANGVTMRVADQPVLLKVMRDETRAKLAEDQRILLLNELNHRIKNTLATVQSIVDQSLRAAEVDRVVRAGLTDRLLALSEAHNILVEESWAGADLRAIVGALILPHPAHRFRVEGPEVRLSARQAVPLSLALHELATNAIKYGALSEIGDAYVRLDWNLAYSGLGERHLNFLWEEVGGPVVKPPSREGFGSRLLSRVFAAGEGEITLTFAAGGVQCAIALPLSSPEEIPTMSVANDPRQGAKA